MKLLQWKNLVAVVALTLGFAAAGMANPEKPKLEELNEVRSQIVELIENPDLTEIDLKEEESTLHFLINKNNELVVLYVDTKHGFVDSYLKSRLNYKELKETQLRGRFAMKITLKNGSI